MIAKTVETYGRLDCAHNNAGIGSGVRARTAEYPEERWHQVIAVNLTGVWLCMKYEIVQMLHQGGGAMVNTASIAGIVGGVGVRPILPASMGSSASRKPRRWSMPRGGFGLIVSVQAIFRPL